MAPDDHNDADSSLGKLILLSEARALLPNGPSGRPFHIHTIRRWIAKGVKVNGRTVRLRSQRLGQRIVTSPEWIDQFIAECSESRTEPVTYSARSNGVTAAERFLILEGVYGVEARDRMLGKTSRRPGRRRGQDNIAGNSGANSP